AESLKVPARVWRATLRACIDSDFTDDLVRIAAPTLILWGNRDTIMPLAEQETMAGLIADSRLVIHPGAGHGLHWEDPDRVARELAMFVGELSLRARAA
ncbi:MAG: alpha/beta fold hydrolase, partial [Alphaproteobacteria bacterium]